jgi:hypothetical protein
MCALCGVLGSADDWTIGTAIADRTRRASRFEQVRVANAVLKHFRLRLDDWQGTAYLLAGPTGKTEIVGDMASVWSAAAGMLGRPIDPLDAGLIDRLSEGPSR